MRGVFIVTIISFLLLGVFAKNDGNDVKKAVDDKSKESASNIHETTVFAPERLKSKSPEDGRESDSASNTNHRRDMATSQTQHSAVVQVQEIQEDEGHRNSDENVPQSYKFGYEVKDQYHGHQFRHEQKDPHGTIHGRFGYRDKEGQYRQVDYVADDHGFRASVKTNEFGVENQNPANVDIEKNQHSAQYEQLPPSNSHSEEVEHRPHPEYHAKSAEEDVLPHTDSSVHPEASHEAGYEDASHEEPPHRNYQRGSETGHHPITLRPREKYSYLPHRQIQTAHHVEERYRKAPLGRRPLYDTAEYHAPTVHYPQHHHQSAPEKKDSYVLGNKGKAASAIVSRHFYKKHLTHHQHVVQHPPQKFKEDSHDQPQSLHYQQLSRGLSARVVPSSTVKNQHPGDVSYETHDKNALRISPQGETYYDVPQHYVQANHPDSRERQQSGEYDQQIEYLPQNAYHPHQPPSNEDSSEHHSAEGVSYNAERDKNYHKYSNNGHDNNHQGHFEGVSYNAERDKNYHKYSDNGHDNNHQGQEYIKEQNLRHYIPNSQPADYHGPRDKEYQAGQQHSNDLPANKVQHLVLNVPLLGRGRNAEQGVPIKGDGEEHRVYVHPAQQSNRPQNYGEHNVPITPQSHLNGGKVHFPEEQHQQHHPGYNSEKIVYLPEQYQNGQNGYSIANGQGANVHGYQAEQVANHHQRSPSLQTNYEGVPHHSNGNSPVTIAHNPHHISNGQSVPVQYLQDTKQQPEYGISKEYTQQVIYNGNNGPGDNQHNQVSVPEAHQHQSYEGPSKSEETPQVLHQGELQQVHHDQQIHQIPVEYHQMVELNPAIYNQLVNTALNPNKVVSIPIIKQLQNGNSGKVFLVGASHRVAPENGQHRGHQKVVEEVPVLVPPGQKHPSLHEGGSNGKLLLPQSHSRSVIPLHSQEVVADLPLENYGPGKSNSPRRSSRGGHKKVIFFAPQNNQFAKNSDTHNLYQVHIDPAEQSSLKSSGQTLYDQYKSVSGTLGKEEPRVSTTSKSKWIPIQGPHRHRKLSGPQLKGGLAHDAYASQSSPGLYPTAITTHLNGPTNENAHYNDKYSQPVPEHASNYGSPINLSHYDAEQGLHGQIRYAPSNKIFFKKSCNCIVKNGKIIRKA